MGNTNNGYSVRNVKIAELRNQGYTLSKLSEMYGLSISNIHRICFNADNKKAIAEKVKIMERDNDIYKLFCEGHTAEYVSNLYGLTEDSVRNIYYKTMAKRSELYSYFRSKSLNEKDARYLTKILIKHGITTVKDFDNQNLYNFLFITSTASQQRRELFIKLKNPESFRLYEFIKQNNEKGCMNHRFYSLLVKFGVKTLDDFRTFNLDNLYCLKGKGDITIGILKDLQERCKY